MLHFVSFSDSVTHGPLLCSAFHIIHIIVAGCTGGDSGRYMPCSLLSPVALKLVAGVSLVQPAPLLRLYGTAVPIIPQSRQMMQHHPDQSLTHCWAHSRPFVHGLCLLPRHGTPRCSPCCPHCLPMLNILCSLLPAVSVTLTLRCPSKQPRLGSLTLSNHSFTCIHAQSVLVLRQTAQPPCNMWFDTDQVLTASVGCLWIAWIQLQQTRATGQHLLWA